MSATYLISNCDRPNKPVINSDFDVLDAINDFCLADCYLFDQLPLHYPVKLPDVGITTDQLQPSGSILFVCDGPLDLGFYLRSGFFFRALLGVRLNFSQS